MKAIIESSLIRVDINISLMDAIALMSDEGQNSLSNCVVVMDGFKLVGLITDWDIVRLTGRDVPLHQLTVADIVETLPIVVLEKDVSDPFFALSLLQRSNSRHLPILGEDGCLLGLVTPARIHRALKPSNLLKFRPVSALMTDQVAHADPNTSAWHLAQLMTAYQVTSVVIVDADCERERVPVGLVTAQDIIKLKHQGCTLAQVSTQTIMHTPLFCLSPSDSLWLAYEEMQQQQVSCLAIVDNQSKLLGSVTQMEILQAIDPAQMHRSGGQFGQALRHLKTGKGDRRQNHTAELERLVQARTAQLEERAKGDRLLAATTLRIHASLNLQEVLSTTVSEVQQLLQTDRTIIYRLNPDGSGVVIVESVKHEWTPMLGKTIYDTQFATEWLEAYRNGRVQIVEDIYQAGLSKCHIDLLAQFQVRANLVLPIICEQKLWGLLVTQHCAQPWRWRDWEVQLLTQLVRQVGIAINQSELYGRMQLELKERQRAEGDFSRLFNLSLDMVCTVGMDGYFKRLNPAFTRTLGYSEQELLAVPFIELVHPDDRQATQAEAEKVSNGEPVNYFENRYGCRDGSYRWLGWTTIPDDPTRRVFCAIARDITEQKQAGILLKQSKDALEVKVEERTALWRQSNEQLLIEIVERNGIEKDLRKAKDQLQAVLDAVPGLVSWISNDLRYLGVNRHVATTFNQTIESFTGQPISSLKGSAQFMDFFQQFFAKPIQTDSQEIAIEVDGSNHNYLIVAQKYDNNQTAVSVGIDISDRKQVEIALKESEIKFRNLVEQTNDWVWEMDCDLRFTYLNPRVQQIIGYTPDEVLDKQIFAFMPADEALRFATVLNHLIQVNESFSQIETTILHKASHMVVLEISGAPVFTDQGELQGYRGITRDITERKQVERDIRKALTKEKELSELKTRFISMASHEFRTPLTTILASAESLERYQFKWTDDKKRLTLQRIQTAVKYMTDLLNDVLLFGKGEAGKLEFNPGSLKLKQFCADLVEEFQFKESNPQRLFFIESGDSIDGWADEKLLRHILVNLLANALKYSPPETSVRLELACRDGTATFQVKDAGIGIPAHEQKRLFDSFYRATNVGTIPGTGLGLAIVMRAVKAHGGTIAVASEAGAGTTFTVSLPTIEVKSKT